MSNQQQLNPIQNRFGLHYFPDTTHYRQADLERWLPEMCSIGIGWLTMLGSVSRLIPEFFINSLLNAGIQPIIHIPILVDPSLRPRDVSLLLSSYARWGVRYISLFDRPNTQLAWTPSAWAQIDLVERFLDIYSPIADQTIEQGMLPVFPPLEPEGDYWDTTFLRSALQSMQRRSLYRLLDNLTLGAYAWTYDRSLNWGAGGPESWPCTVPYFTPPGSQDQRGFRIFDWYGSLVKAELGKTCPILLLRAGSRFKEPGSENQDSNFYHTDRNLTIIEQLRPRTTRQTRKINPPNEAHPILWNEREGCGPISESVLACNFWLLAAEASHSAANDGWYLPDGSYRPIVQILKQQASQTNITSSTKTTRPTAYIRIGPADKERPIAHYLLLPLYAWGAADWEMEAVHPLVQRFHPTVGYSVDEACMANRVTIFSKHARVPQEVIDRLHSAGCQVDRLNEDGIFLAI